MLVAGPLVARRAPNRVVDETQARIGHAFDFGDATIVRAGILHLHDGQFANFFICLLFELNALQHLHSARKKIFFLQTFFEILKFKFEFSCWTLKINGHFIFGDSKWMGIGRTFD